MSKENKDNTAWLRWPMLVIVFMLGALLGRDCVRDCKAECTSHTVQKGESLKSIAKDYYGHKKYWMDIKYQNELKRNWVKAGQKLNLFVPDEDEWYGACSSIVLKRLAGKDRSHLSKVAPAISAGILLADKIIHNLSPMDKLEICRWAIATAEQESMYEFAVGAHGEIGPYQFKIPTVELTYSWYGGESDYTDLEIVKQLIHFDIATEVFVLHFHKLYKKYGGLYLAWKRYNNGSDADAYAARAMKRYYEIKKIQPMKCKEE